MPWDLQHPACSCSSFYVFLNVRKPAPAQPSLSSPSCGSPGRAGHGTAGVGSGYRCPAALLLPPCSGVQLCWGWSRSCQGAEELRQPRGPGGAGGGSHPLVTHRHAFYRGLGWQGVLSCWGNGVPQEGREGFLWCLFLFRELLGLAGPLQKRLHWDGGLGRVWEQGWPQNLEAEW